MSFTVKFCLISIWTECLCVDFAQQDLNHKGSSDSTNDIAHLLGMLDPWYERNTLSLLKLPTSVVCQVHLNITFICTSSEEEAFSAEMVKKKWS